MVFLKQVVFKKNERLLLLVIDGCAIIFKKQKKPHFSEKKQKKPGGVEKHQEVLCELLYEEPS